MLISATLLLLAASGSDPICYDEIASGDPRFDVCHEVGGEPPPLPQPGAPGPGDPRVQAPFPGGRIPPPPPPVPDPHP